jgi:cation diffusion facilitator family transporter
VKEEVRYRQAKKITIIGAGINALLGFIKLFGGVLFNSHALIADGFHSFSDLLTDAMVLLASKYGSQDADYSHPYGHQRIETATTLILALVLILAGTGIAWDSFNELLQGAHARPNWFTIPIALLSILANEALFQYSLDVGEKIRSDLIIANAWHHRSDAASSLVVLIGLLVSVFGFAYFDAIAAILVGFMIIKMGWNYGWDSVKQLVDTAVDPLLLNKIEKIIQEVNGVQKIHQLRSRSMGKDVFVDVHILVSPKISVSEGHFIAQNVHHALVEKISEVEDVTVHVDPEDDETECPSLHLPNRAKLEKGILLKWQMLYPEIQSWTLHYLDGALTIDLFCLGNFNRPSELQNTLEIDLAHYTEIKDVRIFRTL